LDRQYFFIIDDYAANSALLSDWEQIISKISELIDFQTIPLEIYFYDDASEFQRFDNGRNIFINPYSTNSIGQLPSRLNDARLPIWLYAGLEAVARLYIGLEAQNLDFQGLDSVSMADFGDISFIPATWNTDEHIQAIATAHNFVSYLAETGNLEELALLYSAQETYLANRLAARLYYEFTGNLMDTTLRLHFNGNLSFVGQEPRNVAYNYRISAHTNFGNYHFLFLPHSDTLGIYAIRSYVKYFDNITQFVKNFFANFTDFTQFDFDSIDTFIIYDGSTLSPVDANLVDNWIRMFNLGAFPPSAFAHEITHFISFWSQGNRLGAIEFEEGLAMAMERYHDIYDRFGHGKGYQWKIENRRFIFGSYIDALREIFGDADVADVAWNSLMTDFDSIGLAHMMAYNWLHNRNYEARAAQLGAEIAEIGTHPTAGSFVLYLIENYGAQSYMRVHLGQDSFESIYGTTIYEMIARWRIFLDEFILTLR